MVIAIKPGPDLHSRVFYKESADSLDADLDVKLIREVGDRAYELNGMKGTVDAGTDNASVRKSKIAFFNPEEQLGALFQKISNSISFFNSQYWNFDITSFVEDWQYTIYESDEQGHYDWHIDNIASWNSSPRKLSAVIQLSDPDEYEGGDLSFNFGTLEANKVASKKKGTLIIFPSYVLHKVSPVTSGTRRSLVLWISGPKFR
jgi:PKHD-type hydroxylase